MRPILLLSALVPALVAAPAAAAEATVTGRLVDAETGRPVADAFIRQPGGVGSAFSGPDGTFRLRWSPEGGDQLAIQKGGYQLSAITRAELAAGPIRLRPLAPYQAAEATVPAPAARSPFSARLQADYQLFVTDYRPSAGGSFGGLGVHALRLGGEARYGALFAQADLARQQVPVEVAGLGAHENPAFSPESWEARAMGGQRYRLAGLELAAGPAYRLWRYDPHNRDVPYSNTPLDFRQTAHMLGAGLAAETGWSGFSLAADARYYPLALSFADPGDPAMDARGGWQASLIVGREAAPGLFPAIGYRVEGWRADRVGELTHYVFGRVGFQPGAGE